MSLSVKTFFDQDTATFTHVVTDIESRKAAIIDSVLNYDQYSGSVSTHSADELIAYVEENKLEIEWILETHIHADHLTASRYLKQRLGGKVAIGSKIKEVLKLWIPIFDAAEDTPEAPFDVTFSEGDEFQIGNLRAKVFYTPGHTPACSSYLIEDCLFVGDTMFAPQHGTARADFPGGDARTLYRSIHKLYRLPDETRVFLCHDYPSEGESLVYETTIGEQKKNNTMVALNVDEDSYVQKRENRDKTLSVPKLILPSIQHNMRAGSFGNRHRNGKEYIHIPINALKG